MSARAVEAGTGARPRGLWQILKKRLRDPGWQRGFGGGWRCGRALTLVPAPGADLVPAFARTKMFVRRVERVAAERAILARVVVVLAGRHRLAVCTSSLTEQKSLARPRRGVVSSRDPPFRVALFPREVSLTPESAALYAPRGRRRGLSSSPKTDEHTRGGAAKKDGLGEQS